MLLRSPPKLQAKRLKILLPEADWRRLERIEQRATQAGMSLDITGALAAYLQRQIDRAERELHLPKQPLDQHDGPAQ